MNPRMLGAAKAALSAVCVRLGMLLMAEGQTHQSPQRKCGTNPIADFSQRTFYISVANQGFLELLLEIGFPQITSTMAREQRKAFSHRFLVLSVDRLAPIRGSTTRVEAERYQV